MGPFLIYSAWFDLVRLRSPTAPTSQIKNRAFQGYAEIKITSCNFNFINNFFKIIDMLTLCIHAQLKYDFGSIPSASTSSATRNAFGALPIPCP